MEDPLAVMPLDGVEYFRISGSLDPPRAGLLEAIPKARG